MAVADPVTDLAPGLGDSQRVILGLLKRRGEATIAELDAGAGLARESVRDHLRSLHAAGLVERTGVRRDGARGRPRVVYRLSARGEALFPQREAELLRQMAAFLLQDGQGDLLERFFASRARDKRQALRARVAGLEGMARVQAVAAILDEEGFLPEVEEASGRGLLRLCHCPLREIVSVSQLPCRAELALVEDLLGRRLRRESFMPDGSSSCTYSFALPAATPSARRPGRANDRAPGPPVP